MRLFCLFFCFALFAYSNEAYLSVTENDPSSLVEGVSVITGDLYSYEEDYVVQGAEPIHLPHSFISGESVRNFNHLTALWLSFVGRVEVNEPNGTTLCYFKDKKDKSNKYVAHDFTQNTKGITNTSKGKISAQTHLKNQHLIFREDKTKGFTLYASDGTHRFYEGMKGQKAEKEGPLKGTYLSYAYKLVSETLPNGHVIRYAWDDNNQLKRIYTTNPSGSKTYAEVGIRINEDQSVLTGSDERSLVCNATASQTQIISPEFSPQTLNWESKPLWMGGHKLEKFYLKSLSLPKSRTVQIGYGEIEDPDARRIQTGLRKRGIEQKIEQLKLKNKKKNKEKIDQLKEEKNVITNLGLVGEFFPKERFVKTLSAPVGKDESLITTHSFTFDKENKRSYVFDADSNKTAYFWNDDLRLTQVIRYSASENVESSDRFVWDHTDLKCKMLLDAKDSPVWARTYLYDDWGNIKEEAFYGNLSGKGTPLAIGPDGLPAANGVESYVKKRVYSEDGRHLLLREEDADSVITYTYRPDAQLLETKTICPGTKNQILHKYEYDKDFILVRESVLDQHSHTAKIIVPRENAPYIGLPDAIKEVYFDEQGNEILLKKTTFRYGAGATVIGKDIYDAEDKLRYSLAMTYDEKSRLTSETNPIGQQAIYRYDEVGNRIYAKDFSGKLETFYDYDFSNRLIKKQEKGSDGIDRIETYEYDLRHNLIEQTDPYDNVTRMVPDALGRSKEIHLPCIENEKGELVYPFIQQTFDAAGNIIEKTDAEKFVTRTKYNAYGKPIEIVHPDDAKEEFTYDLNGRLKTHTDALEVVTEYTYDSLGRVLTKNVSDAEETFVYEGQYLIEKKDAEKNVTTYKYDRAGRKIEEVSSGEKTTYEYDTLGRLWKTHKADLTTITDYDLLDRVTEERNETKSGVILRKVQYEYDEAGNQKAIIRNIQGHEAREESSYDSIGRLTSKKNALGDLETWAYTDKENKKTHTDPMGLETIETYNGFNQVSLIEKKKNNKTLFSQKKFYNLNGQLTLQKDTIFAPDGTQREVRTRWEYDSRGLVKTLIEAEGTLEEKITKTTYSPRKEIKTVTKPNGIILTYSYDDYGHLISLVSSDDTLKHEMTYNLLGHLQTADGLVRTTDAFGRIVKETFPSGLFIENTYDDQGRRETCKIPKADCWIDFKHDAADLKVVTRKRMHGSIIYSHSYLEHDLSGNVLSEQRIDSEPTRYAYDSLNRKFAVHSFPLVQEITEFDPAGNILKMRRGGIGETVYTYDDLYQLTKETGQFDHTYSFDSLNNRLQRDGEMYEINSLHQIASHFKYDLNGNPVQHNNTIYSYDALDRLLRIEAPEFIQIFEYDSLHRCLSKRTIQNGNEKREYFLYDGQNEIGSFDEDLNPKELRVLGNAPHAEIGATIAIELNGAICAPIHDLQGNLAVLKPLDADPSFYHYTAFGEEKVVGGMISPWRFSSKRTDSQSQLVYFGRRFYMPGFGRWLTPDPAGFTDGMNLYAYVHNNPLNHFDEYGLWLQPRSEPFQAPMWWKNSTSYLCHELYEPISPFCNLASQMLKNDRSGEFISRHFTSFNTDTSFRNTSRLQDTLINGHASIDRFWGTSLSPMYDPNSWINTNLAKLELPMPGRMFSTGFASQTVPKVAPVAKRTLNSQTVISSSRRFQAQEYVNPHTIRFAQPTASQNFSNRGEINDLIKGLRNRTIKPEDVPIIRVVEYEGKMYTLDNRRLAAFQNAGIKKIPIKRVSLGDPKIEMEFRKKFKPICGGEKIVIIPNSSDRIAELNNLRSYGKIE
ncbi:MAG: hypothetical protein K1X28_02545 [Parachlamydiales bacterium]|nr:hypothetical protein [Parachlamydiales bacterium]